MSKREADLQRQLDDANRRIAALEAAGPVVEVTVEAPASRNALQTVSDWWHGGATQGARSRHMRVNY